jgi:hypothetical protein
MIVDSMVATTFSLPSLMAKASAVQTVSVRHGPIDRLNRVINESSEPSK